MLIKTVMRAGTAFSSRVYHACLDIVAPPICAGCKLFLRQRATLCPECLEKITPVASVIMPITGKYELKVFAISGYADPIKPLILSKSWSNVVASTQLGELIWQLTPLRYVAFDYIIPVPLHWMRYAKRGYNQAEEMANVIAYKSGKPVEHLVKRVKRTQFQSALELPKRALNVEDAFTLHTRQAGLYKGKHLLIVDDLLTTGATLRSTARELIRLQPASIVAVVAARVV